MGLRFPEQIHGQYFFVTTTFKDWQPLGNIPGMYEALAKSLAFCLDKYGALVLAYVFMPSHIHLILNIDGHHLGSFMRDFKKYIAQKAAKRPCGWIIQSLDAPV
jgi:REP element-mobilizing transposase RayT